VVEVRFLGHATVQLTARETTLIVDPWLNDNPSCPVGSADVAADVVVVTHAHVDHWGDSVALSERGGLLVSNPEIARYSEARGARVKSMGIGGTHAFEGGWLKFFPAWHSSSFPDGTYGGTAMGVVIQMDGTRIYHAGDTGLFTDMQLVGELGIDLAILPIGDNFTMGPGDALRSLRFVEPKRVLPVHYDTFPLIRQDAGAFAAQAAELGVSAEVLKPGESFNFVQDARADGQGEVRGH
jgi:L-ascorbate metabolism protein UlaG (beta-lactamase superfamily)